MIKNIVFQEVVSKSESGDQPLGQLAGRGVMGQKHKGGKVVIKSEEHQYIIGIVSIVPKIDYSQGNRWDTQLKTMDDFHKPQMDEIGFQDLIQEQMSKQNYGILGMFYELNLTADQKTKIDNIIDESENSNELV